MKRKILLCWNYERPNWVSHFEKIFEQGSYSFINYYGRELEKGNSTHEKIYYWGQFKSVDHLINEIDPEFVIFMGLDNPYSFLLNHACKERGIRTYFLQHGIFHSYRAYLYEEQAKRRIKPTHQPAKSNADIDPVSSVSTSSFFRNYGFFIKSFTIKRISLYVGIIKFLSIKRRKDDQRALKSIAGELMQADIYIVYTMLLSKILEERDKVPGHKLKEIGNDEANQLIARIKNGGSAFAEGNYYVFIDEAFTGSEEFGLWPVVSIGDYNDFLLKLAKYAESKGKFLKIKLHPFSYNESYFIQYPNIEYVRDTDIAELIGNSYGIFGCTSTLLIPAMFVKKACIFRLNGFSDIHSALIQMDFCKVLDFYDFETGDIEFKEGLSEKQMQEFTRCFLYQPEINSLEKLKKILLNEY